MNICPPPTLKVGERLHGFHVLRIEQMPDIRVTAYEIEHEKTGAKVLHLHCDDRENLYSIGFRTPPKDSTGVAHILEHSVLAGSEKYPLKDAFNELAKGTLQTFINAFTYPDKTIYPVASQARTDFFNLARVYTDLVLRPRLLKETFSQEGHHLEFENLEDISSDLTISGIVYNEMKGVYSSPDSLMYKAIQEGLYPNTTYSFDSGGNPDVIPSLTYEQFTEFHRTYYSPTNARFFLYGNILTEDHLVFLKEMLSEFDRVDVDSSIETQSRWETPSPKIHGYYPIGKEEESLKGKSTVNLAWMMAENTDYEAVLFLEIVSEALAGSAAGPLRKALINSGLGEDLSPVTGLEADLIQLAFAVGLRGTDPDKAERIEALTLETLKKVVDSGFDPELIEGALHQVEFHGKEIVRSYIPYSIALMGRAYHTWLYDGDPLVNLKFSSIIEKIRKSWKQNPRLFQEVVQRWFLDNPHRLLSVMEPSKTYNEEQEAAFRKKMADLKASFPNETLEEIRKEAVSLLHMQMTPDTPEALAKLPKLKPSDIPRAIEIIPTVKTKIAAIPTMEHDIFANGIAYIDLSFDITDVPEDLQPYLPLLGKLATDMGAAGMGYEEMAKRIALKTGGLGCHLSTGITIDGKSNWQKMIFSVKALHRNVSDAVKIVEDILTDGDLSDEDRMRDLIAEAKNGLHSAVVPSGHAFARRTAASGLSVPAYRDEQWGGRTQLQLLSRISDQFKDDKNDLREKLARLRDIIFRKDRLILNLTADSEGLTLLHEAANELVLRLANGGSPGVPGTPELHSVHAGIAIPAQVCYVAKVIPAPTYSDPLSASLLVLSRELSSGYLYKHIRVQGGAYGGMSMYDTMNGNFSFLSYRDPNLVETLKTYDDAVEFISQNKIEQEELEKAVIGTIGSLDKPMDPSSKGYAAMIRDLAGITDEDRQNFRNKVLETSPESLIEVANRYIKPAMQSSAVAVYADAERLSKANKELDTKLKIEALV
jgi:Zn-dependent M16 (insulinase) family peptidase